jgi:NAD(P)-dependent dehydrogenase (short-subunit alcohol dehydrogenase family)
MMCYATEREAMEKTAVVAGASGGIGRACALELHKRGYACVLNGRREAPLKELSGAIGGVYVAGDCGDEEVCARIAASRDRIDVIVHSVGILSPQRFRDQSAADFDAVVRTNLRSVFVLLKACVDKLEAGSKVILISSIAPKVAIPGTSAYSAAKSGMNAFADVLARELEPDGIGIHLVSPGPVATEMLDDTPRPWASLSCEDVSSVVGWLTTIGPHVIMREIDLRAASKGPFRRNAAGGQA